MKFWATFFDDVYARTLRAEDISLPELGELIKDTSAPTKAGLPLLMFSRLGTVRTPAPARCLRHDGNVLAVSGLVADYDREAMPFEAAVDRLDAAGIAFIAYTSPSHTPTTPRWRVACPFSQELPPADHGRLMNWLNGVLGGGLAEESWKLSQSYYYGRVAGAPFEMHVGDDERCIDEADFEAIAQPYRPAPGGGKPAAPDFDDMDEAELIDVIQAGAHYWGPVKRLLAMWARQCVSLADAESNLGNAFDAVPQPSRGKKWNKAKKAIPRWVKECYERALKKRSSASHMQLVAVLEEEPQWKGALRYSAFTETLEVCTPFPPRAGQTPGFHRALRDEDVLEALVHLQANGFPHAKKGTVWDVVTLVARRHEYHPVKDWLQGLRWDGAERVDRLFLDYFPGELPDEQDAASRDKVVAYYEKVAECFMVGAVARIFQPGCKLDTLPVFVAPQGFEKSKGLRALVPDEAWFTDDLATAVGERDAKESLTGKWLIELAEFPHIRKDVDRVKAFFSRQVDRFRRAYGRLNTDHPRQCAFCASANELEFLDVTGNRRTWPISLAGPGNVEAIERDREQLWAEAVHWYRDGYKWWLSPSLEAIAGELQDAFVEGDVWDDLIIEALDRACPLDAAGNRPPFMLRDVLKGMGFGFIPGEANCAGKADEIRAARRLRRLGFRPNPHRSRGAGRARLWVAVQKPSL